MREYLSQGGVTLDLSPIVRSSRRPSGPGSTPRSTRPRPSRSSGWDAIAGGSHTLMLAPTGSGKTLAAFLWAIDRLVTDPVPPRRRALPGPLRLAAQGPGGRRRAEPARSAHRHPPPGRRASATELPRAHRRHPHRRHPGRRAAQARPQPARHPHHHPRVALPHAHVAGARDAAQRPVGDHRRDPRGRGHQARRAPRALARTARGAHPEHPPQRIGLSATQRPLDEIARFLGGRTADGPRPVTIVDAGTRKDLDIEVIVPVDDMSDLGSARSTTRRSRRAATAPRASRAARTGIWPHVHPRLLELIRAHRSTLDLRQRAPAGGAARRPAQRARPRGRGTDEGPDSSRRTTGRCAREQRLVIEDELKQGELRGARRDQLARARHRHGRGRPRHPGRVARLGVARVCSASAAPATRSASRAGARSSRSTAATCSRPRPSSRA